MRVDRFTRRIATRLGDAGATSISLNLTIQSYLNIQVNFSGGGIRTIVFYNASNNQPVRTENLSSGSVVTMASSGSYYARYEGQQSNTVTVTANFSVFSVIKVDERAFQVDFQPGPNQLQYRLGNGSPTTQSVIGNSYILTLPDAGLYQVRVGKDGVFGDWFNQTLDAEPDITQINQFEYDPATNRITAQFTSGAVASSTSQYTITLNGTVTYQGSANSGEVLVIDDAGIWGDWSPGMIVAVTVVNTKNGVQSQVATDSTNITTPSYWAPSTFAWQSTSSVNIFYPRESGVDGFRWRYKVNSGSYSAFQTEGQLDGLATLSGVNSSDTITIQSEFRVTGVWQGLGSDQVLPDYGGLFISNGGFELAENILELQGNFTNYGTSGTPTVLGVENIDWEWVTGPSGIKTQNQAKIVSADTEPATDMLGVIAFATNSFPGTGTWPNEQQILQKYEANTENKMRFQLKDRVPSFWSLQATGGSSLRVSAEDFLASIDQIKVLAFVRNTQTGTVTIWDLFTGKSVTGPFGSHAFSQLPVEFASPNGNGEMTLYFAVTANLRLEDSPFYASIVAPAIRTLNQLKGLNIPEGTTTSLVSSAASYTQGGSYQLEAAGGFQKSGEAKYVFSKKSGPTSISVSPTGVVSGGVTGNYNIEVNVVDGKNQTVAFPVTVTVTSTSQGGGSGTTMQIFTDYPWPSGAYDEYDLGPGLPNHPSSGNSTREHLITHEGRVWVIDSRQSRGQLLPNNGLNSSGPHSGHRLFQKWPARSREAVFYQYADGDYSLFEHSLGSNPSFTRLWGLPEANSFYGRGWNRIWASNSEGRPMYGNDVGWVGFGINSAGRADLFSWTFADGFRPNYQTYTGYPSGGWDLFHTSNIPISSDPNQHAIAIKNIPGGTSATPWKLHRITPSGVNAQYVADKQFAYHASAGQYQDASNVIKPCIWDATNTPIDMETGDNISALVRNSIWTTGGHAGGGPNWLGGTGDNRTTGSVVDGRVNNRRSEVVIATGGDRDVMYTSPIYHKPGRRPQFIYRNSSGRIIWRVYRNVA